MQFVRPAFGPTATASHFRRGTASCSNTTESCLLAPVTQKISVMPGQSMMMWRLLPSLPLSVGLGPVHCPPVGWPHPGWRAEVQLAGFAFGHSEKFADWFSRWVIAAIDNRATMPCQYASPSRKWERNRIVPVPALPARSASHCRKASSGTSNSSLCCRPCFKPAWQTARSNAKQLLR